MISSSALLNIARLFIEGSFSVIFVVVVVVVFVLFLFFLTLKSTLNNNDSAKCSQMFPRCIRTVNVLAFKLRYCSQVGYLISCFATFSNRTKQSVLLPYSESVRWSLKRRKFQAWWLVIHDGMKNWTIQNAYKEQASSQAV